MCIFHRRQPFYLFYLRAMFLIESVFGNVYIKRKLRTKILTLFGNDVGVGTAKGRLVINWRMDQQGRRRSDKQEFQEIIYE